MMRLARLLVPTLGLVGLLLISGCGEPDQGEAVYGTVTFQGQPLDQGTIEFHPVSSEQSTLSGAAIENGEYAIPAENGLEPGKYQVRITSSEGGAPPPAEEAPGEPLPPARERIPPQYNVNTTLEVEVKEGEENRFNFDLK